MNTIIEQIIREIKIAESKASNQTNAGVIEMIETRPNYFEMKQTK